MGKNPDVDRTIGPELAAAVLGKPLPSTVYLDPRFGNLLSTVGHPGSDNFAPIAFATRYVLAPDSEFESVRSIALRYARLHHDKFCGDELGRIYPWFHLVAWLAIARDAESNGDDEVFEAFAQLIAHMVALRVELTDDRGNQLWIGQRGAGWPAPTMKIERELVEVALDERGGFSNVGPYFVDQILEACRETLRQACAAEGFVGRYYARSLLQAHRFRYMEPIRARRYARGMAVWMARSINQDTQPVLGAVSYYDGRPPRFFPAGCDAAGERHRAKPTTATVVERGGRLIYDSVVYGHDEAELPGGELLEDLLIGGPMGGVQQLRAGAPGVPPPASPPVEPEDPRPTRQDGPGWFKRLRAWLRRRRGRG